MQLVCMTFILAGDFMMPYGICLKMELTVHFSILQSPWSLFSAVLM